MFPGGIAFYYARMSADEVQVNLTVPKGAQGKVRVFMADPDSSLPDGRKQKLLIAGDVVEIVEHFGSGRWIEHAVTSAKTGDGKIEVQALNGRPGANAVISMIEWVEAPLAPPARNTAPTPP